MTRAGLTVLIALAAAPAAATPRFAVRNDAPCALCHVNPTGGGMRTAFGRAVFARQSLSSPWLERALGGAAPLVDARAGGLTLGADLRGGYLRGDSGGTTVLDSFFLMQADLYASATVGRHVTLYVDRGAWGGFEAFALAQRGETAWPGYVKLGRFVPPFGVRADDHTSLTREGFGFGPAFRDTGVEAGAYLGGWLLQAAYVKGAMTDQDPDGTIYGRAEWRGVLGALETMAGASASFNDDTTLLNPAIRVPLVVDEGVHQFQAGAHLALSLGRMTWLGEATYARAKSRSDGVRGQALATWQQLSFLPAQGIELQASYEYLDGDLELATGITHRLGASLELYPLDGTEVKVSMRRTFAPRGDPRGGLHEMFAFVHVFF